MADVPQGGVYAHSANPALLPITALRNADKRSSFQRHLYSSTS